LEFFLVVVVTDLSCDADRPETTVEVEVSEVEASEVSETEDNLDNSEVFGKDESSSRSILPETRLLDFRYA
jgi:hypothetical protein